jgi:hypothetical protein
MTMSMFDLEGGQVKSERTPTPTSEIDHALTAQFVVAWAGESGEEKRLAWWRSDLVSEFGGEDLFRRVLPSTWPWAILQAAREAARRKDAELRRQDHNPDRILSLFSFGFELDERIEERLQDLKRSALTPQVALPGLADGLEPAWNRARFIDWIKGHGEAETNTTPIGRCLKRNTPTSLDQLVQLLVAALSPLAESYPLPHFRKAI